MKIITDERCVKYSSPGHPEQPARVSRTLEKLRIQTELSLTWGTPLPVAEDSVLRAHTPEHLRHLKSPSGDFDADTPVHEKIHEHALRSVGGALAAMQSARQGGAAFSLLRPPGHHATANQAMGFCYLNSTAIAVLEALHTGCKRVGVYDFDVHHGNGTEAILRDHPGVVFCSIHQYPCYPGTGTADVGRNCFNFPAAPGTSRAEYRKKLTAALKKIQAFKPELVAVSAGFDCYARDPLAHEPLETEDFLWLGESIRKLDVSSFSVLEGGYSPDLPDLILAFLKGLENR